MKKKAFLIPLILPVVLGACAYHASYRKPSFRKYSNQVTKEEFVLYFMDQYKDHNLFGAAPNFNVDKVFEGYDYYNSEKNLYSARNKLLYRYGESVQEQTEIRFDKESNYGYSDFEGKGSRSKSVRGAITDSFKEESKVKIHYLQGNNTVVEAYEKPKVFYINTAFKSNSEYVNQLMEAKMAFGDLFTLGAYYYFEDPTSGTSSESSAEYYVDNKVFTVVYSFEYNSQSTPGEKTADIALKETIKKQVVLQDQPIYASVHEYKETSKFLVDTATNVKGEMFKCEIKAYSHRQVKLKKVRMKAIDYSNYERVDKPIY